GFFQSVQEGAGEGEEGGDGGFEQHGQGEVVPPAGLAGLAEEVGTAQEGGHVEVGDAVEKGLGEEVVAVGEEAELRKGAGLPGEDFVDLGGSAGMQGVEFVVAGHCQKPLPVEGGTVGGWGETKEIDGPDGDETGESN